LLHRTTAIPKKGTCIMQTFEGAVFTVTAIGAQMLLIAAIFAG
jgi:hypothetical protein